MTHRERRRRHRSRGVRNKVLLGFGVVAAMAGIAAASFGLWVLNVAAEAPDISELKPIDKGENSVIYAADGSRLGFIQSDEARTPIPFKEMPRVLRQATIAIEDARFYQHQGVDVEAIARAAKENIEEGATVQGGSTITQQLVKNLYTNEAQRDLEAKIREAKLASELEEQRSKRWILRQYLNTASYGTIDGRTAVGVEAAAQTYFGRAARKLDLTEAALLAGLPQSPSLNNPFQNPDSALQRRNEVIKAMAEHGYISQAEASEAYSKDLGLDRGYRYTKIKEPYFFDFVEQQLIEKYGVNTVRKGGLEVHTTIVPELQEAGRLAIDGRLGYPGDPSAAVVTIDPRNGDVLAMASSGSYQHQQYNLAAQGRRQPGSAFKTFVLSAAVRQGVDPDSTTYVSKPLSLDLPEYGHWEVSTYSNSYSGAMNLTQATLASDNTVYAQLDLDIGPEQVRQTAYDMGIETELDALPAEGIGGLRIGVSPLEMANAYATLASGGIRNTPTAIEEVVFPDGETDVPTKPKRERALSEGVAAEVTRILEMNVQSGTGTAASTGCPTAGKTGTTDDFNDAWFVGYTPEKATAVWVGYPDALRSMTSVHGVSVAGGTFPAEIWGDYMQTAKGDFCGGFPEPSEPAQLEPFQGTYAASSEEYSDSYSYGNEPGYGEETAPDDGTSGEVDSGDSGSGDYGSGAYAPGIQDAPDTQVPGGGGGNGGSD